MAYEPHHLKETAPLLITAFIVGVIAQFLRQKTDDVQSNTNIWWYSLAAGFSAVIIIGFLYTYTDISGPFLVSVSGIAGWAGIQILTSISTLLSQALIKTVEKKLDITIEDELKEVTSNDKATTSTGVGSQTE